MKEDLLRKLGQGIEALENLKKASKERKRLFIVTHKHADIDALASAVALYSTLCSSSGALFRRSECRIIVPEGLSLSGKQFLEKVGWDLDTMTITGKQQHFTEERDVLLDSIVILVDTASFNHLGNLGDIIKETGVYLLLDHHEYNEVSRVSSYSVVHPGFSSSSEIVALMLARANTEMSSTAYCVLQAGIISDTSRFIRSGPLTFEAMSLLTGECAYRKALELVSPSRRSRSETIALLKAFQRIQIITHDYIVVGTFVSSNESQVLGSLISLGVDAGFVLSLQHSFVRVSYRLSDSLDPSVSESFHKALKRAFSGAEGPKGHRNAGVYIWRIKVSKRDLPRLVKRALEEVSRELGSPGLG